MAELVIVEGAIPKVEFREFGGGSGKPENAVKDEFYDTLIDKVNSASKKAQGNTAPKNETPISDDKEVSETLKKTIKDVFEGEEYGVDFADSYAILDEEDKAEFESIILGFINVLEKEIADEGNAGAVQSLLDRLFPSANASAEGVDPYADVRNLLLSYQDEGTATAEELLNKLVPMLLEVSAKVETAPSYEYGTVSANGNEMSLEDMLEAMQELAAMMAKADAGVMENPEQTPEGENPEGEIPEISGGTEIPVEPEVPETPVEPEIPEVNEGGENTETPEVPEVPEVNEGVETPEVNETPETSVEPETPEVSDETEIPDEVPVETPAEETETETEEVTEEHLESPAEMVDLLSRNGFSTTSTGFTRSTTELEEIAVSSISQQNIQNFGNVANFDEATMMSVQRQVITATQEIMGRLTVNSTEDVSLVLNPENLGRISVRLTNQGGDIIIRIAAESEETQAILRERLPSLMQSLTEINNSVREITVEEISQPSEMQANLMFGNGSNAQAQSQNGNSYSNDAVEEISETEETDSMKGVNRLWQKA